MSGYQESYEHAYAAKAAEVYKGSGIIGGLSSGSKPIELSQIDQILGQIDNILNMVQHQAERLGAIDERLTGGLPRDCAPGAANSPGNIPKLQKMSCALALIMNTLQATDEVVTHLNRAT